MRRFGPLSLIFACLVVPVSARHDVSVCGTTRETPNESLFLHRQSVRARAARLPRPMAASATTPPAANRDMGNIAVIEDTGGVVERLNQFNLDNNTLTFTPTAPKAAQYRYSVAPQGYDSGTASQGTPLAALDDDDTRLVGLPFAFPFFGAAYNQVFVNSDGNLTFTAGDFASSDRSLGRMTAGPPRISPLFDDLDPSQTAGGVRVFADSSHVVVSWVNVPEYAQSGAGPLQTFQVRLYPDGSVQFSYAGINAPSAVVGIAPGGLKGSTTLVDFRTDATGDYSAAVAERFGDTLAIDIVTVAQQFYQTHEDSYDYLAIYNNMDISAMPGAVAYESTARSSGTGYGFDPLDDGQQYGSASRLQSVINLGPLSQYPTDPTALVPARAPQGDTPLTILAHEAGHLFLAYASVNDPNDPSLQPMLGYGGVHWSFVYDSEASLLEGERIADRGAGVSPRFLTTDTVQGYSPLDQYLMGFRPPEQVPDTFLVTNYSSTISPLWHPLRGVAFDGARRDIGIDEIIQVEGRRTPDYAVAQRRFRFAFILVVAQGSQPSADDLAKVDAYRQQFETFYAQASSNNAVADTSLKRSMKLSLYPNAGVVVGGTGTATLTLQTPPSGDLTVQFQAPNGNAQLPALMKIPAGAPSVKFTFSGLKAGVEEVLATPADPSYETAFARVQVADASILRLVAVSGDRQLATSAGPLPNPIVVRLTDANNLPYPGAQIVASSSAGGSVTPPAAVTDVQGQAAFTWTPGPAASNQLQLALGGLPAVGLTLSAGSAVPVATAVVNAASFANGVAAGAFETVFGVNLAGGQPPRAGSPWFTPSDVQVLLNGSALPLLYVSDTQIDFYVPEDATQGTATLSVVTPSGAKATATVDVVSVQPGIFPNGVLHPGTGVSALTSPVHAGDYIEIYCTGLGPTQPAGSFQQTALTPIVFIGATPVQPVYSGLAPGYVGLYQVNAQVPAGLAPGLQPLLISVDMAHSNQVNIAVQ
jgi:uncharacterized protein (TIGR03437 family)